MTKKLSAIMILLLFSSVVVWAGQPGVTGTVFNKRFLKKIKPMMPYQQVVQLAGTPGKQVGEDRSATPPKTMFHWDGGRKSALDIKVAAGKVVDATVVSPKGTRISLGQKKGLLDFGD